MLIVGIDPGVTTGLAVWSNDDRRLTDVTSMPASEALLMVARLHSQGLLVRVVFEDARLRTWFDAKGREALQGAGSIKRDCSLWEEWLRLHGIEFRPVSPLAKGVKWDAATFKRFTGWTGRTNEHARDAAVLVWRCA